ncbi:MarR family transcriptional regulator [Rhizobium sp. BR 362]|uniref:MarR family transcriptional regulator n=1 Tax=Rhizobium sp. BR 362 TaxID=3040670 RepID=UPI002F3FBE87
MTSTLNTQLHSISFAAFILQEIMGNPREDETPQSRLKQVGMMSVLYIMHQGHQPLTISNLVEITKLTRMGVSEVIEPLIARGMLTETFVKNSMGRGKARQFAISDEIFEKLRSFQIK